MCLISLNVLGFTSILFIADSKCDINSSQDFRCLFGFFFWQWLFYTYMVLLKNGSCILNFSVVQIFSFHYPIFLILCVNALYFHKLTSGACEVMVLMFLYFKTILLLSGIACSFCGILGLHSHRIQSLLSNLIL
jgi:hypothetical protein